MIVYYESAKATSIYRRTLNIAMDTAEEPKGDLVIKGIKKGYISNELCRPKFNGFKKLLLENEKKKKELRTKFGQATVENAALSKRFKKLQIQKVDIEATNSDDGIIRVAVPELKKRMNTVLTSQSFCLDCGRPYQALIEVALSECSVSVEDGECRVSVEEGLVSVDGKSRVAVDDGECCVSVEEGLVSVDDGECRVSVEEGLVSVEDGECHVFVEDDKCDAIEAYLAISLVITEGDFDNFLQWPFSHKVTFRLINQTGGRDIVKSFQPHDSPHQKLAGAKCSIGTSRFASINELSRKGFIQEDTMIVECHVNWN